NPEPIPEELKQRFKEDPPLKNAFESLTPGRQRGYILYFSSPKQSKTRVARIEKSVGKILRGEGLHDKYQRRR
ncbi:MAG: YdeI/OmpD-associated family protein, partial [Bacteroidota bacterium]